MRHFLIVTSRGSSANLEIANDDWTATLDHACETASAVYRAPRSWSQTDNTARGTYLWNGQDVHIIVIDVDNATATEALNATEWLTA